MMPSDIRAGKRYRNRKGGLRLVTDKKFINNVWHVKVHVLTGVDMGNVKWITLKAFAKWAAYEADEYDRGRRSWENAR